MVGLLTIELHLEACASLKEKRRRLKPLLARLHREFNVSAAEMGLQDSWQEAIISCAIVGNEQSFLQSALSTVAAWVKRNWPDGMIVDHRIEIV
jgi:uncharacterized protein YlxP (DUF503 family)